MKKITIFTIALFALAMPLVGYAQSATSSTSTEENNAALIEELRQTIEDLKEQISRLAGDLQTTQSDLAETRKELAFTRRLAEGSRGEDVEELQEFLSDFADIYPEGLVTGYFGPLTERAVERFQERYGLERVGIVGPRTRARLNQLLQNGAGSSGNVPPGLQRRFGTSSDSGDDLGRFESRRQFLSDGNGSTTDDVDDNSGENAHVCHIPPGNAAAKHTISVGAPAVLAHLRHGDTLGRCDEEGDEDDDEDEDNATSTDDGSDDDDDEDDDDEDDDDDDEDDNATSTDDTATTTDED